jgi:hypothetical protein
MSGVQDPLDDVFLKADKIYEWINQISNGNKKQGRTSSRPPRYQNKHKPHQRYDDHRRHDNNAPVKDYYAAQDDLFD